MQAGGGHLRQQDGHVLLLLPQPDQPLPHVGVHHAQRHLLLPTQRLVEVCEVSPDAGARALCCAGDLRGRRGSTMTVRRKAKVHVSDPKRSHVFRVRHADAVLDYLLPALYLLNDSHQLPRVLRHLICEGADTVGHVQNGGADLVCFGFQESMLEIKTSMSTSLDEDQGRKFSESSKSSLFIETTLTA